jgi:hypothetical protein
MARCKRNDRINWLVDSLVRAWSLRWSCDLLMPISTLNCSTLKFSSHNWLPLFSSAFDGLIKSHVCTCFLYYYSMERTVVTSVICHEGTKGTKLHEECIAHGLRELVWRLTRVPFTTVLYRCALYWCQGFKSRTPWRACFHLVVRPLPPHPRANQWSDDAKEGGPWIFLTQPEKI